MNRVETRALVEGAIFSAVTVVIGIIRFYVPIFAIISLVWSVPTILVAFRHGLKTSTISVAASSVLVAVITHPIEGLGFFIGFGLPGIIMGYLLKRKLNPWVTIFITGIVLSVCSVASIYLGMRVIGLDISTAYNQIFTDMKNAYSEVANSMSGKMGVSREEILKQTSIFEKNIEMMRLILPGGILISGIMLSLLNFKLTKLVLKRINYFIEDVNPYSMWRLPDKWMYFVTAVLLYVIVELYFIKSPQLYASTMNIFMVITLLFMVLGLSVAKFFLDKYKVPKALKGIILFFLPVAFGNIIMLVGVLDMSLDLRKLRNKPLENA